MEFCILYFVIIYSFLWRLYLLFLSTQTIKLLPLHQFVLYQLNCILQLNLIKLLSSLQLLLLKLLPLPLLLLNLLPIKSLLQYIQLLQHLSTISIQILNLLLQSLPLPLSYSILLIRLLLCLLLYCFIIIKYLFSNQVILQFLMNQFLILNFLIIMLNIGL